MLISPGKADDIFHCMCRLALNCFLIWSNIEYTLSATISELIFTSFPFVIFNFDEHTAVTWVDNDFYKKQCKLP